MTAYFSKLLATLAALGLAAGVAAQLPKDPPTPPKQDAKAEEQEKKPEQKPEQKPEDKPKEKTFDDYVKDFEKSEGLFTLYRKKTDIYLEVKPDQLGKLFLLQTTLGSGTGDRAAVAGDPVNDQVFRFEQKNEQLYLVTPNLGFRAQKGSPIERSLRRSLPDGYLAAYKIESTHPERKSLLVKINDLFLGDISRLSQSFQGYNVDRDKTFIQTLKAFPLNILVESHYHFAGGGRPGGQAGPTSGFGATLADPRSLPIKVVYNLSQLPEDNNYRPRTSDPRIGYFTTDYQQFDTDKTLDPTVRYILRWHLPKKDPSAALSEPAEPIVFWLDNAIPEEYRPAVREGLLLWNKAFERIGFKDAIQVKQMPDDADWDIADMRYNTIRWVSSPGNGYAIALFRANPLTGQILNASISVDSSMTRYSNVEYKLVVENAQPQASNPFRCEYGEGAVAQAWYGALNLELDNAPKETLDQYVYNYIKEIVCHEMGHILGLRHNFKASTNLTLEQMQDENTTREVGVCASVMDYNPVNLAPDGLKQGQYWNSTIGPYDIWAIEYGYKDLSVGSTDAEKPLLAQIASRCNEPGHQFASDENADSVDPTIVRFDLGADPLAYYANEMLRTRAIWSKMEVKYPAVGENYYIVRRLFEGTLNWYTRAATMATRFIGGVLTSRNHKGDPSEKLPVQPVSSADQQRVLKLLNDYVFAEGAWNFKPEFLQKLAAKPEMSWNDFISGGARLDYDIVGRIQSIQRTCLVSLMNSGVLARIQNNQLRSGIAANPLTIAQLMGFLKLNIWAEVTAKKPIGLFRRSLQRDHLQILIDFALKGGVPDDARAIAYSQLKQLVAEIREAAKVVRDPTTLAHLEMAEDRILKTLDSVVTSGGS